MARAPNTHFAHLRRCPVMEHEVDVRVADTSSIELDENLIGLDFRNRDLLDLLFCVLALFTFSVWCEALSHLIPYLDLEVRTLVHNNTSPTLRRNFVSLLLSHGDLK